MMDTQDLSSKIEQVKKLTDQEILDLKSKIQSQGNLKVKVVTSSMTPLIQEDEVLTIHSWSQNISDLKRFDIILYVNENRQPVCHFIYKTFFRQGMLREPFIITKGLSLKLPDKPVYQHQILGVAKEKQLSSWQKVRIYLELLRK